MTELDEIKEERDRLIEEMQENELHLVAQRDALFLACSALLRQFENDASALDLCIDNWPAVILARSAIRAAKGEK